MSERVLAPQQIQWANYKQWSGYKMCKQGILCSKKDQCPYRHLNQQYEYKSNCFDGYITLLNELKELDRSQEERCQRAKYLGHILGDHKDYYYHLPCRKFDGRNCKEGKNNYKTLQQGYELYIQKQDRIKKKQQYSFMNEKLGFGMYSEKTWYQVEKYHAKYINWLAQKSAFDGSVRDKVDIILQRRRNL